MNGAQKTTKFDPSGVDASNLRMTPPDQQVSPTPASPPIEDVATHMQSILAGVQDKLQSLQRDNPDGGIRHQMAVAMVLEHARSGLIMAATQTILEGFAQTLNQHPSMNDEVQK